MLFSDVQDQRQVGPNLVEFAFASLTEDLTDASTRNAANLVRVNH